VKVNVGPVEPACAHAWIGWVQEMLGVLRREAVATLTLTDQVLDDVGAYVDRWCGAAHLDADAFRWHADVHPDELEYLTNCLYNLDRRLADQTRMCSARREPIEGRSFHVVLVDALLFALAHAGPSQAAFAEQLRSSWPVRHPDMTLAALPADFLPGARRWSHLHRPTVAARNPVRLEARCARTLS
jgi:hypothetical protein